VLLFIRASAFKVLNADKCCACSTHHEEYCDNLQQKFQSLVQFGPQIFFCHFSRSLSHAEHLFHLLTLMGDHCTDHCQHSCVQRRSVYVRHTPEIFPLACHPPYACCDMISVAASDLFIYCSGVDIFIYIMNSCTLKEQTTAIMPLDVKTICVMMS
jgi:hypothetical protein